MNDSVVLVTGGAGNLGRAVTRAFLESGARVVVPIYKTDTSGSLDALSAEFRERLHTFALDLTTERGAEQAVRQAVEWGGRLDTVAHLVGAYLGGQRLGESSIEVWDRMLDLNLKSAWLTARFAIPRMAAAGGGTLVFVSSRAAWRDRAGHALYAVAKAGLLTLVEAIAEEYGAEGIRAYALVPDTLDTAGNRRARPHADHSRWSRPEDLARLIVDLAGRGGNAPNGAAIPVFDES